MLLSEQYEEPTDTHGTGGPTQWAPARTIKDPIHDQIPLSSRLCQFIDTRQFQRLRNIKQLGTSYYVWAGASHNRFEHCIGVAYLARLMASHIQKHQPELEITNRDIECVEIAGLCHDLGHGPWSHVWDNLFMKQALPDRPWQHEDGSELMFDYLVHDNGIDIDTKDQKFIKALIAGDPSKCKADEKCFLFDIVANRRNGLDVDKFDYILRDSHHIGDCFKIALPRIIKSARVLDNQICYDIKDANQLYEICATRFKLHKIYYNHKAAKAIEYMIMDGLLAAEPYLKIAERVFKPKKFLHLTDNLMCTIEESEDPNLSAAKAIFERIHKRELYKMVDFKSLPWMDRDAFKEYITPQRILDAARAIPNLDPSMTLGLSLTDIIVDFSVMHYGMKDKNPVDFVKFYSKRMPNQSANAQPGDYSTIMPNCHAEVLMRIFTKKNDYFGIIQAGYRACLKAVPGPVEIQNPPESSDSMPLNTPPLSDPPSTPLPRPRTFSRHSSQVFGGVGLTPISDNNFTTVPTLFVPPSPTRGNRKPKRGRGEDDPADSEDSIDDVWVVKKARNSDD